ncbi:MAG: hypothetical protein E7Z93_05230 [Cyanobacteria bacterium SIG32]|nr:hypothetical protein [Cyanobacteria bacterium SIG32]
MNENLMKALSEQKIFPIIRSNDPNIVVNTVDALLKGGLNIMEINVESVQIYDAIKEVSSRANVCAGGIITSLQAQAAIESGAKLFSSPIFHMNLVKLSKDKRIPYIAGTSTANEAYQAWKARIPLVKIYPITAMGGASYLEDLLRPMNFLNILPQGSVKLSEVKKYIDAGAFAVGVGRDLFDGYSYSAITERVQETLSAF